MLYGVSAGLLEHPRDDRRAALRGDPLDLGDERPVERLGVRREVGARLAEVAGERLGQHDQVGAVGHQRLQPAAVVLGVERRRLLHQHHLHGPSLPPWRR